MSARLNEVIAAATKNSADPRRRGPGGIGMGVAFDWGLAAQLLITAPCFVSGFGPGSILADKPLGLRIAAAAGSALAALGPFALGEGLRRGRPLAWLLQIAANSVLTLGGLASAPLAFAALHEGRFGDAVRTLVLLGASPAIVYLLTRSRTRAWISSVSSAEARARHTGWWLAGILCWAVIGGFLIAFQQQY